MRVMVVYGTRPEAIKLAPVAKAMIENGLDVYLVNAGQHDESLMPSIMSWFSLPEPMQLRVLNRGRSLPTLGAALLEAFDSFHEVVRPDVVMVQGDTSTALFAGMAAFYAHLPVAHVEAGLRTYVVDSPFPEEMSRRVLGTFSSWNFAPSLREADNLRAEKAPGKILVTGNTIVDALQTILANMKPRPEGHRYQRRVVATIHRRENQRYLADILGALADLAKDSTVQVVFPVHPNPTIIDGARKYLANTNVQLIKPLDYIPWLNLVREADLIITDSGGLQEEAPVLGIPLLIARDVTERHEVVQGGYGYLVGHNRDTIVAMAKRVFEGDLSFRKGSPYGDGRAASRVAQEMLVNGLMGGKQNA